MKMTDKLMQTPVSYGGEILPLGQVWADVQKIAPNQVCADRYIQGLLLGTKLSVGGTIDRRQWEHLKDE